MVQKTFFFTIYLFSKKKIFYKKIILTKKNKKFYLVTKMKIFYQPNERFQHMELNSLNCQRNPFNLNKNFHNSRYFCDNVLRNKTGLLYYDKFDELMPIFSCKSSTKSFTSQSETDPIEGEHRMNNKRKTFLNSNNNSSSESLSSLSSKNEPRLISDSSNLIRCLKSNLNEFLATKNSSFTSYTNKNLCLENSSRIPERYSFETQNINILETTKKASLSRESSIKIRNNSLKTQKISALFIPNRYHNKSDFRYLKGSESFDRFLIENDISNFVPYENLDESIEAQSLKKPRNSFKCAKKVSKSCLMKNSIKSNLFINKPNREFKLVSSEKKVSNLNLKVSLLINV